ncbi:DUF2325 domain-containing protein [Alkalinema pantanalense CENA528]|uniref:DUF2325 domain-containing protein n=1 Tax=Alkalinema pantanalense TaxID=1620705 RepID=UPI003D7002D3
MNLADLDQLEVSVTSLVSEAEEELERQRLHRQRAERIEKRRVEIASRLNGLLTKVESAIAAFSKAEMADNEKYLALKTQADQVKEHLNHLDELAEAAVDEEIEQELLEVEERRLDERSAVDLSQWRQELKEDLLELIAEQDDFYDATDAAITIYGYRHDLKAVPGALEEVVEALVKQINDNSDRGPVARIQGTHESALQFIYNKAWENRGNRPRNTDLQPQVRHRKTEKRPNPYTDLAGKVVIFGGHDRLYTAVRNRLRESEVELVWCTAQEGLNRAEQIESHIPTADLVMILTGYASHKLTEKAKHAAQKTGKQIEMINTTGLVTVLEAIAYNLKVKSLVKRPKYS